MNEQEYVEVGTDFNPGHPDHAAWRGEHATPEGAEQPPATELHSGGTGVEAPPVLDLTKLSLEELRARCKEAKLPTTGRHDELVARLAEHAGAQLPAPKNAE